MMLTESRLLFIIPGTGLAEHAWLHEVGRANTTPSVLLMTKPLKLLYTRFRRRK
jgi:hypothetical protein